MQSKMVTGLVAAAFVFGAATVLAVMVIMNTPAASGEREKPVAKAKTETSSSLPSPAPAATEQEETNKERPTRPVPAVEDEEAAPAAKREPLSLPPLPKISEVDPK